MGPRAALLEDELPSIEVESFEVETPALWHRRTTARPAADRLRPPGYAFVERVRRRYVVAIGAYRDFRPRTQSTVEHRLDRRAGDVIDVLFRDRNRLVYDSFEHEYRIPIDLHLAWSWPALPMWLAVGEVSSTKSALRLSLRSRRRVRYPARYFNAAHAALTDLEITVGRRLRSRPGELVCNVSVP